MPFCVNCGSQMATGAKFCPNCGNALPQQSTPQIAAPVAPTISASNESQETAYFKGEGELVVKRTEHRGAGRKVASLALGPVGYLAFGRDKTRKSKAEGMLVVTNEAIYCAGNDYPFDRIISITKQGTISKSIVLTFEKDVEAGGRASGGALGIGGLSIEVELKTRDIDALFRGLERAKMAGIKGL
jgi:hypothetical protein